jgi:hypothetical protein
MANTSEPKVVIPSMDVVAGNHPFAPLASEPIALQAVPFHFATWSACAIPAMSLASEPT